ncbi:MAG: acyltransferase [Prevotella sp.]
MTRNNATFAVRKYCYITIMDKDSLRQRIGNSARLKHFLHILIMNQRLTRPRWFVRLLAPLYQKRALSAKIYKSVRMDTPPYRKFVIGKRSVVESYSCINNAVGDVTIGDFTRIGLHSTIIGPVAIGSHVNLAQGITVSALNHNFSDSDKRIDEQGIETKQIIIEDDVWIGANAVVLAGVTIGHHSVVAAGAVVNRDVPPHSLVAGVPAKVKRNI